MKLLTITAAMGILTGCHAVRITPIEADRNNQESVEGTYYNKVELLRNYHDKREGEASEVDKMELLTDVFDIPQVEATKSVDLTISNGRIYISNTETVLRDYPIQYKEGDTVAVLNHSRIFYIIFNAWNDRECSLYLDVNNNLIIDRSDWGGGMLLIFSGLKMSNQHYKCVRVRGDASNQSVKSSP